MLTLLVLIASALVLGSVAIRTGRRPARVLKHGKLQIRECFHTGAGTFYVEEVAFADYQDALNQYFRLLDDVQALGEVLDTRFSYLDWTDTTLRFAHGTVRLVRCIDRVRMIQSLVPLSFDAFEEQATRLHGSECQ